MQNLAKHNWLFIAVLLLCSLFWLQPGQAWADGSKLVYEAKLEGEISQYMVSYLERVHQEAAAAGADVVLLELDTYGGYVDAAVSLKQVIMDSEVPTYCYVNDKAISAGSLIALSCEKIAMKTGGSIGAAEPRLGDEKADEKVVSFWTAQLTSAAESHGRDTKLAAAMSDSRVVIEGLSEAGRLLTLTSAQAVQYGMADFVVNSSSELLSSLELSSANIVSIPYNFQEQATQILNNSVVSTVLLVLGIGCLVLEVLFAGVGIFAALGVTSLALYFIGALLLSYTAWIAVALAVAGLVLLILEIFVVPGFGACGILGIASIVGAVICVAPSMMAAMLQIGLALLVTLLLIFISLKFGRTRRVWNRLILQDSTSTESGYVSPPIGINDLLGECGMALTDLRPSGAALLNGKRTDVLTEGSFVLRGTKVRVIKVEGSSVIVVPVEKDEPESAKA